MQNEMPISAEWAPLLNGFRAYLLLERGLSGNTQSAYLGDMRKLAEFCALSAPGASVRDIDARLLQHFLQFLSELGLGARSQARVLSALKTFFKYLNLEQLILSDPTELLEGPRLPRNLPEVLSVPEVDSLLAAVDLSTPHGLRNRAMLETLYACGLRVSELCELRIHHLFPEAGFVRVVGKGDKERIVPIGEDALVHIDHYVRYVRMQMPFIHEAHAHFLFLNRRGKRLSRVMVFEIVKESTA